MWVRKCATLERFHRGHVSSPYLLQRQFDQVVALAHGLAQNALGPSARDVLRRRGRERSPTLFHHQITLRYHLSQHVDIRAAVLAVESLEQRFVVLLLPPHACR